MKYPQESALHFPPSSRRRLRATRIATAFACALLGTAFAQQVPDAGSLLRQVEPPRAPALPSPEPTPAPSSQEPRRPAGGPQIVVRQFEFEGNERFNAETLQQVIAGFLNRPVTLADLDIATALVAQYYRNEGWLARVLVPPQSVEQGVVRLKVVEARLGATRFSDDTDTGSLRVPPAEIQDWVQARQAIGQPVYLPGLERGLLLANDLPGLKVQGSQISGASEGQTDVLLTARNDPVLFGDATLDNMGSRGTGIERLVLRAGLNSLLGRGDQFDVQAQITEGLRYGRVSGMVPVGHDGLRVGAYLSGLDYRVVTRRFIPLHARGHSTHMGAQLNYPLVRSTGRNLYLGASLERKSFFNSTGVGVTSDYASRNAELKLDGNFIDALGGGAITTGTLAFTHGDLDLSGSPNQVDDARTTNTQGNYRVWRYRLARNQAISSSLSLMASFGGQTTGDNLDSSEKFYLGGPYGVRAYPVNEGGGSRGNVLNVDLRWQVPSCGCTASVFYDRGHVTVNARNNFPNPPTLNSYSLSGWGVGVSGAAGRVNYTAQLARRIGSNPNAAPDGRDQDGTLKRLQVWVGVGISL